MELAEPESWPHFEHFLRHSVERSSDVALLLRRKVFGLGGLNAIRAVDYPLQAALPKTGLYDVGIGLRVFSHAELLVDLVQVGGIYYGADACSVLELARIHGPLDLVSKLRITVGLFLAVLPNLRTDLLEHQFVVHGLLIELVDGPVELALGCGVKMVVYWCR